MAENAHIPGKWLLKLLRVRVWVSELIHPSELQVILFWAGVIGFGGAAASVGFRYATNFVHQALTGQATPRVVESFAHLPWWQRLAVPAVGGLLAGLTLHFGSRLARRISTDYMEAIVLGDGTVPARSSLVKCLSAMFSIASGASIGREGPLVQLAAMIASLIGRWRGTPPVELRLLVACGAAAGIASAYNAPIAGALFVAEIILGSMAMESFGPLVFSSVISTLTVRYLLGSNPLYEIEVPVVRLQSNWEILPYVSLGLLAGIFAPWFLRFLRGCEQAFARFPTPPYVRLTIGGLIVGALAVFHPKVCGNGYTVINEILHGQMLWQGLLVIFVLKILATGATFGSGAVGGVFTPTLFVGACMGELFAGAIQHLWPYPLVPSAFALVGMGAFLAATTHAPLMAIIMLFELTLDYEMILPLMLACVIAHYTCSAFEKNSIYSESLKRKGAGSFRIELGGLTVADLMKPGPPSVRETARFTEIAESFIRNRFNYLYVTSEAGEFRGAISMHDIKTYLNDSELAQLVIARDILRETFPTILPGDSVVTALERFSLHDGERLPVISSALKLIGSVSKTDLLLALAAR